MKIHFFDHHLETMLANLPLVAVLGAFIDTTSAFSVTKNTMIPGVWKLLIRDDLLLSKAPMLAEKAKIAKTRAKLMEKDPEILLKLNEDGHFTQITDDYREGLHISGVWSYDEKLVLALDRQYYGPRHDIILEGNLSNKTISGSVYVGKFTYPKRHPSFFENPLIHRNNTGAFSMEQALSNRVLTLPKELLGPPKYKSSDFFGRTFYLTVEPIATRSGPTDTVMAGVSPMTMQFHSNRTFQAFGNEKILRGRFAVSNTTLSFRVSVFGSGRSAPGSVYSQGRGLSKDDECAYKGEILENQERLFVTGTVLYGTDLGSDARPEPVGRFNLVEVKTERSKVFE